jgi:hypothetical protein
MVTLSIVFRKGHIMAAKLDTPRLNLALHLAAVAFLFLVAACGHPQTSPQNRPLFASLRTAVSAQNIQWLEQNAQLVEQRRAAGEISDDELAAFQAIIRLARNGEWEEAESRLIAWQKAQRPTTAEVQRVSLGER